MLNYETKWMRRDEIVQSTYQAALRLNQIKHQHGLTSLRKFKEVEKGIKEAITVIDEIDATIEDGRDGKVRTNSDDLNKPKHRLKTSTLCDKDELRWPVRFLRFNFTRTSFRLLAFLRLKNILWLILRGPNSENKRDHAD